MYVNMLCCDGKDVKQDMTRVMLASPNLDTRSISSQMITTGLKKNDKDKVILTLLTFYKC